MAVAYAYLTWTAAGEDTQVPTEGGEPAYRRIALSHSCKRPFGRNDSMKKLVVNYITRTKVNSIVTCSYLFKHDDTLDLHFLF